MTAAIVGLVGCLGVAESGPRMTQVPAPVIYVEAVGIGRPPRGMTGPRARLMARRAAEVQAARNLAAKLADRTSEHRRFRTILRGHQYTPPHVCPDGTVIVRARIRRP